MIIKTKTNKQSTAIVNIAAALMGMYFSIFFIYPLFKTILGSFMEWNPLVGVFNFIGTKNYSRLISDPIFKESLVNTIYFTVTVVLGRTVLGFVIALMLFNLKRFSSFFRGSFFLPVIMPIVSVALVWDWMYEPRIGLINSFLAMFGVVGPNWLADTKLALNSVMFMTIWKDVGYTIIIFYAGLLNVPNSYLEAAKIDGANYYNIVLKIIIPTLKPTLVFVLITSLIGYFQTFTQIFIMTKGGPGNSTYVISFMIYNEAFKNFNFGYASALSTVLLVIIIIVTFIQFQLMRRIDE